MQNNPFPNSQQNNPFMNPQPIPPGSAPVTSDDYEVDLTDVSNGFTIPDGNYKVVCTDIEQSVSKGGNPMFVWSFEISEGPHAGFQSKVFTAITPAAMWKVAETVEALGVGQTGTKVKFNRTDVLNKECGALFEKSEYNGQERSQITRVISLKELAESMA